MPRGVRKLPSENFMASKQIKASTFTLRVTPKPKRKIAHAEELAGDNYCEYSIYFDDLKEAFPAEKELWSVHKKYPYSKPSALYVDEPHTEHEVNCCLRKADVLAKLGVRYAILETGSELINEVEGIDVLGGS